MASVFDMPAGEFLDRPQERQGEQPKGNKEATVTGPLNPEPPLHQAPSNIIYTHTPLTPLKGQGMATLFRDIGEGATEAIHGVDTFFKGIIDKELHDKIDPLRDKTEAEQFGKLLPGQINQPPPQTLKNQLQGVQNYKTAAEQGNIPHIYYEMQLNSVAKSMRSQHPGYREYIDEQISHITGGNPANKVINELFKANAAAHASKVDKDENLFYQLLHTGVEHIKGFDNMYKAEMEANGGQRPSLPWLMQTVNKNLGDAADVRNREAELRLRKETSTVSEQEIMTNATYALTKGIKDTMVEGGTLFADVKQAHALVDKLTLDPDGTASMDTKTFIQAQTLVSHIAHQLTLKEQEVLANDLYDGLSPKNREELHKMVETTKDLLTGVFADKQFKPGIFHAALNAVENMKETDTLHVKNAVPALRALEVIRRSAGDTIANTALTWNKHLTGDQSLESAITRDMKNLLTRDFASILVGTKSLTESVRELGPKQEGAAGDLIDTTVNALTNPNIKPEAVGPLLTSVFSDGDNFLTHYENGKPVITKREDRDRIFNNLTQPKIIELMKTALDNKQIAPEVWDNMQTWVGNYVSTEVRNDDARMMKVVNVPSNHYMVLYNPTTHRFEPGTNSMYRPDPATSGKNPQDDLGRAMTLANRLNTHMDPLARIYEANGKSPDEVTDKLRTFFANPLIGIDLDAIMSEQPEVEGAKLGKSGKFEGKAPTSGAPEKKVKQVPIH